MKLPRRIPKCVYSHEDMVGGVYKKASIYISLGEGSVDEFQLYNTQCDFEPYDELDFKVISTQTYDTLDEAIEQANKFVATVD